MVLRPYRFSRPPPVIVPDPPAILIDSLDDARVALAAAQDLGVGVTLRVREDTAAALGADVIARMVAVAREEFPGVGFTTAVDCGDAPGLAIALLRRGVERVSVRAPADAIARLAAIAEALGARALGDDPAPALDLGGARAPRQACRRWLGAGGTQEPVSRWS